MGLNKSQFENLIIRVLKEINLFSDSAVNLLLGTAAQESQFGTYLKQLGTGPALGFFQMEKPTFDWLKNAYAKKFALEDKKFEELEYNLKTAIIFCRLRYFAVNETLPNADDITALAAYWKKYYNSVLGAGKTEEFIANYKKYVGEL